MSQQNNRFFTHVSAVRDNNGRHRACCYRRAANACDRGGLLGERRFVARVAPRRLGVSFRLRGGAKVLFVCSSRHTKEGQQETRHSRDNIIERCSNVRISSPSLHSEEDKKQGRENKPHQAGVLCFILGVVARRLGDDSLRLLVHRCLPVSSFLSSSADQVGGRATAGGSPNSKHKLARWIPAPHNKLRTGVMNKNIL